MLNRIILMGRMTRNPELRYTTNGTAVASFSLAVNRDRKGEDGNYEVDFFDVIAWRQTAEYVVRNFQKGSACVLEGRLQNRDWQDRDGNKRRSVEIVAENIYFSGNRAESGSENRPQPKAAEPAEQLEDKSDLLPF